jgi:TPR repeat protein
VRWFTLASDRDYSPAIISLADAYMDLNNPERNYKEAFRLYKRVSESGDVSGYYKLGSCYYKGKGTPRNYIEASKCFRKGLEANMDSDCQYMLGMMYIKGEGVQKNHKAGMMMVRNAANDGNEEAMRYLKRITSVEKPSDVSDDGGDDQILEDLNTPDLIGGVKGAEHKGLFGFLRRRM